MLFAIAQMQDRKDKLVRNDANKSGQNDQNDEEHTVDALFAPGTVTRKLYDQIRDIVLGIDSSLEETPTQNYASFKYGKGNVISLWPKDGWIELVLGAKLGTINDSYS